MWRVTERNRMLAIEMPYMAEQDRPVESRPVSISRIRIDNWATLVGQRVDFVSNEGLIRGENGKRFYIQTDTWEQTTEERPVKKPRKGRRQGMAYDWEWAYGKWRRVWVD